jgi:tape measure domain-containing protein
MARASVELIVEAAKAINPLRKVERESKKVDRALKENQKGARNVEAAFQRMGRNSLRSIRKLEAGTAKLGKRMRGLRANVAKAAIAFSAFKSAQVGIQRIESERRIKFLAESYGEVAQLQDAATASAKKFGIAQTEANRALANVFARLRPVGVGLRDIVSIYNGFNTAARISGSTATEASNAFTQLAQALGSGALRGDEFNSISEQVPGILTAISKETGVAQGQLRAYAAEGLITSDIVIRALKRIETEGAAQLEQALGGPAQAIADFQNATQDVQVALTETVIPELSKSFVLLAGIITDLKPVIESVGSFAATVLGGVANTIERIRDPRKLAAEQQAFLAEGRMRGRMRQGQRGLANLPANYAEQEKALFAAAAGSTVSDTPLPAFSLLSGKGATKAAKDKDSRSAMEIALGEAAGREVFQNIQDQLDAQAEMGRILNENIDIATAAGKAFAEDFLQRSAEKTDLLKDALQGVGDVLGNQLMNVFDGLISKTLDFNDAMRSTLAQVGRLLMTAGLNSLAGSDGVGVLSFLGFGTKGKANGGPVNAGRPYMVGERGPELFVPSSNGGVMRNEDMRQLMGRSPASAVAPQMNFSFETTNIGGTEYVSREQLEAAMATTRRQAANDGAKRGMNMTLDKMQNSPRTRSRIGIS